LPDVQDKNEVGGFGVRGRFPRAYQTGWLVIVSTAVPCL